MKVNSSTIAMSSLRGYSAEAKEQQATISRQYNGDALVNESVTVTNARVSQTELESGSAVFSTSANGAVRTDGDTTHHRNEDRVDLTPHINGRQIAAPQAVSLPEQRDWLADIEKTIENDPELHIMRTMLKMLEKCTGRKFSERGLDLPEEFRKSTGCQSDSSVSQAFSAASMRYQETVAMISTGSGRIGSANAAVMGRAEAAVNGRWTRQVIQSGFVSGAEHTAFSSKGSVVTSDGRSIEFSITLEMSRSFEAAYLSVGQEEVFTDPLVINLDTDAAALSDVSFFFDLNCDGTEERLSALAESSGFLALDKDGDGVINDGSELFGAATGDGFGELAAYDSDGNGWIDEADDIFSRLSVMLLCGNGEARLLSLSEANVGALFLGSQRTQFTLADSFGDTGAVVRSTGLYLRENGIVGTMQHLDFKT